MPSGVVTLGQAAARLSLLTVACNRCERAGRLRTDRLLAERIVLPRMLLDAYGASVRRWLDERALDRGPRAFGPDREDACGWPARKPVYRHNVRGLGHGRVVPAVPMRPQAAGFAPELCGFR